MTTTTGNAWEVKRLGRDSYSVRHRRDSGAWETPSYGGWDGHDGALHALFCSGVSEATAKRMLDLAAPGKLVRLHAGEVEVLDLN